MKRVPFQQIIPNLKNKANVLLQKQINEIKQKNKNSFEDKNLCEKNDFDCLYQIKGQESFFGIINSREDAELLVFCCLSNKMSFVSKRLDNNERKNIRNGSVFVFNEETSGMIRWTDGMVWSPSRMIGDFLTYKEKVEGKKSTERFIKKTISIYYNKTRFHLVGYQKENSFFEKETIQLKAPSSYPFISEIGNKFLDKNKEVFHQKKIKEKDFYDKKERKKNLIKRIKKEKNRCEYEENEEKKKLKTVHQIVGLDLYLKKIFNYFGKEEYVKITKLLSKTRGVDTFDFLWVLDSIIEVKEKYQKEILEENC